MLKKQREKLKTDDIIKDNLRAKERAARMKNFNRVSELVEARNPTQKDADKRLFVSSLKDTLEREDFRRYGWAFALNARAIFEFWDELMKGY